jgi:hypothetical protein
MSEKKILTKEIAEQFIADELSVYLSQYTSIEDVAAEVLSEKSGSVLGSSLNLEGITSLSDEAAESLSKFKGDYLLLDGITSLSDAAAESLSKLEGGNLQLSGLASLSDEAAESLSGFSGNFLLLDGITSLGDAAAKSLSNFGGNRLSLNGLTSLSDAAAESLSELEDRLRVDQHIHECHSILKSRELRKKAEEKELEEQKKKTIKDSLTEEEILEYNSLIKEYQEADGNRKWEIYSLFTKNGWGNPY